MNTSQENNQKDKGDLIDLRQLLLHEIAHKLVEARTAKQEPISKPVRKLKIPVNHLRALENGNWDTLPDDVYVIGFLRQYSKYLSIDLSDEIDRLKNTDYTLTRPLTFPDPPVAPSRLWAWLTGGAFVVLFILFNVINYDDNKADQVAYSDINAATHSTVVTTDEHNNNNSNTSAQTEMVTPPVAAIRTDTTAPSSIATALAEKTAKQEAVNVKHADKVSNNSAAAITRVPQAAHVTAPILSKAETFPSQQSNKVKAKTSNHVFRFEAVTAPVWMQIFLPNKAGDGKGRLLKEMLLKKGHFANIRYATETLWITCGNALALRIKVDRKTVVKTGKLGNGKKVLRDYRFDINKR